MNVGVRANALKIQLHRWGLLNADMSLIAQGETREAAIERFSQFMGEVKRNGTPLGHIVSAELTYSNNLDKVEILRPDMTDSTFNRFADLVSQGKTDWKSWADAGKAAIAHIEKELVKLAVLNPLKKFGTNLATLDNVGGLLSSLFGFKLHGGGIAGVDGSPRVVPTAMVRGAPRLHDPERLREDASKNINMRKVDGWQTLATAPLAQPIDLAA